MNNFILGIYHKLNFYFFKLVFFTILIRNEIVPWQALVINPVEQNLQAHLLHLKQKVATMQSPDFPILYLQKALHLLILYPRQERIKIFTKIVYWVKRHLWYVIDFCFFVSYFSFGEKWQVLAFVKCHIHSSIEQDKKQIVCQDPVKWLLSQKSQNHHKQPQLG